MRITRDILEAYVSRMNKRAIEQNRNGNFKLNKVDGGFKLVKVTDCGEQSITYYKCSSGEMLKVLDTLEQFEYYRG